MRVLALLVFSCLLSAAAPANAWVTKKKYAEYVVSLPAEGERPSTEYVQRAALAYFKFALKDADSAKYEWGDVELGSWRGAGERFGTPGWVATVSVNGKNSYGGYTGFTPYKFVFRSGSIVEIYEYSARYQGWSATIGVKGKLIPPLPDWGKLEAVKSEE